MTEIDPHCLAAAGALANGDAAAMTAHAKLCASCAFLATLVRDLPHTVGTAGIGRTFEVALERAIDTGETLLSRYTIESIIARGGQGIVCRATDREFGPVAIKILRCKPSAREDRLPEGRVAMKLAGEGVCRIFNIERHGDIRLVVMELVEGTSLEDALPRLPPAQRLAIFRRVCRAVARMHSEGILHLDLKPRNIVLSAGDEPVITDFGIAVTLDRDGRPLPLGHTRGFAPPEQIAGERVDRRADVHALGITLELLLPRPTAHVRRVIARATSRDPERRHGNAAELLADLDRPSRVRRTVVRVTAAAAALGLVVVGAVLGLSRRAGRGPDVIVDSDGVDTYQGGDWMRGRLVERGVEAVLRDDAVALRSELGVRRSSELYCAWFQLFPSGSVFLLTTPTFPGKGRFSGAAFVFSPVKNPVPRWTVFGDEGDALYPIRDAKLLANEWRMANIDMSGISQRTGLLPIQGLPQRPEDREPSNLASRFSGIPGADPSARLDGGIARLAAHFGLTNFIGWPFEWPCRTEIIVQEYDNGFVLAGAPNESCGEDNAIYLSIRDGPRAGGRWNGLRQPPLPVSDGGLCKRARQ